MKTKEEIAKRLGVLHFENVIVLDAYDGMLYKIQFAYTPPLFFANYEMVQAYYLGDELVQLNGSLTLVQIDNLKKLFKMEEN